MLFSVAMAMCTQSRFVGYSVSNSDLLMRLFVCCHGDGSDGRHAYTK